jgi:hypothetical protein
MENSSSAEARAAFKTARAIPGVTILGIARE